MTNTSLVSANIADGTKASSTSSFEADERASALIVSAVMPCLNEVRSLGTCIKKAQSAILALGIPGEVVVADNGSTDGSIELAESLGARVIHANIRGYGAALRAGIEAARGEVVVMADSDDSYDWGELGVFVTKVREGFDLVMGNRFAGGIERGAMPWLHRYIGNPILSWISRIAFRSNLKDFHCGMRAFTKQAFQEFQLQSMGMEFATEMIASSSRLGHRIAEVPVRLYPDQRGRPPHLRTFRDGWRHLRFIVSNAPDHLYLWPGTGLLVFGVIMQAILAVGPVHLAGQYVGIHFLVLGGLMSLLGLNVLTMGTMAKLVVGRRFPKYVDSLRNNFLTRFTVERGLITGLLLFAVGFAGDAVILYQWLGNFGQPMEHTVHPALVSTNLVVLGVNVCFSSFLIHLMTVDE